MSESKVEYIIVYCGSHRSLAEDVNVKISEGYKPIGGISIRHGSSYGADYMQAMVLAHNKEQAEL